jgi:hypothetical protein
MYRKKEPVLNRKEDVVMTIKLLFCSIILNNNSWSYIINCEYKMITYEKLMYRARNIVYYYSIDTRPRSVYLHVIREMRNDMKTLLAEYPPESVQYQTLLSIVRECPQKIKEDEVEDYVLGVLKPTVEKWIKN